MKGQTVNIDWSIGLALFLVTILSSVLFIIDPLTVQNERAMDNKVMEIQETLQQQGARETVRNRFYVRSPGTIENVPFDRKYFYRSSDGAGIASPPSLVDVSEGRFATVLTTGNSSATLNYFEGDFEGSSQHTDLSTGTDIIENSEIRIDYRTDIDSARVNGKEAIQMISVDGTSGINFEDEVLVEAFSGNLRVFNNSREFIIEDDSFTVRTKNYSRLYWHRDETYPLTGTGTIREGETEGLTVAESGLGATFMGDLNATVSKPDRSTVEIQIDAPRTRIRLHESGTGNGERVIDSYSKRDAYFGTENVYNSFFAGELKQLEENSDREFETSFGLVNWGYNMTVTTTEQVTGTVSSSLVESFSTAQEWRRGSFSGTQIEDSEEDGGEGLRIGYLNGSSENVLSDGLAAYWRMDKNVSGSGGTVQDYSGKGNNGETRNGVNTDADGILGTGGFEVSSSNNDYIDSNFGNGQTGNITLVSWIKLDNTGSVQSVFNPYNGDRYNLRIQIEPDGSPRAVRYGGSNVQGDAVSPETIGTGTWHMVAGVYDAGQDELRLYVDGEEKAVSSNSNSITTQNDYYLGIEPGGLDNRLDGVMDEARIYNRALTAEEIKDLYFEGGDGRFTGNYTTDTMGGGGSLNWNELRADIDLESGTEVTAAFRAIDGSQNVVGEQEIVLNDGFGSYGLDVPDSEFAEIEIKGATSNISNNWKMNNISVTGGTSSANSDTTTVFSRGQPIAFEDTSTSERQFNLVTEKGEIVQAKSRVVLWR